MKRTFTFIFILLLFTVSCRPAPEERIKVSFNELMAKSEESTALLKKAGDGRQAAKIIENYLKILENFRNERNSLIKEDPRIYNKIASSPELSELRGKTDLAIGNFSRTMLDATVKYGDDPEMKKVLKRLENLDL